MEIQIDVEPDKEWNNRLLQSNLATIHQSQQYANYIKKWFGWTPRYVKFYNNFGKFIAQNLIFEFSRIKEKLKDTILGSIPIVSERDFFFKNMVLSWSYGPITFFDEYKKQVNLEFLSFLHKSKKGYRGYFHPLEQPNTEIVENKKPYGTFLIDLSKTIEEIWEMVNYKHAQKNIQKAKANNLIISNLSKDNFDIYYQIYKESRILNNLPVREWQDLYELFQMQDSNQVGFIVWKDRVPLAGVILSTFGGYMIEYALARSKKDDDLKTFGTDYLKWYSIEWAKKNSLRYYDFAGVDPSSKEKNRGIYFYKEKWGGQYYDCPIYTNL